MKNSHGREVSSHRAISLLRATPLTRFFRTCIRSLSDLSTGTSIPIGCSPKPRRNVLAEQAHHAALPRRVTRGKKAGFQFAEPPHPADQTIRMMLFRLALYGRNSAIRPV